MQSPPAITIISGLTLAVLAYSYWPRSTDLPPALPDTIPYVSNTYQYMTDMRNFLDRATRALRRHKLVSFHLGPMKVYLVTGAQNVQALFRTSTSISSNKFMLIVWENIWCFSKEDLAKFTNDTSGRLPNPAPGTENHPAEQRYWAGMHHVLHEHLARASETDKLAVMYRKHFTERLETFPAGELSKVRVVEFLRKEMLESAVISMIGPKILELNPDFKDAFWEFDEIAAVLAWGLPRWLNGTAWEKRDRLHAMFNTYLKEAWEIFDWNGPDANSEWEPVFGSRLSRELAKWSRDVGLDKDTTSGGFLASIVFGLNANTIPLTIWGLMEIAKDASLFQAVRDEVLTACNTDPKTGRKVINIPTLLSLPLLQSIYIELLRLHVSINVTREIMEPIILDGHKLEKGALLQAPSEIAQYEESVWAVDGHPASEFWAGRHLAKVDFGNKVSTPQFSLSGRSNDLFPYGGGVSICPGRFFAKQEIMWTLGILVLKFDIEEIKWINMDGSPSDRPARNHPNWAGGASEPPDRDLQIRWKRI
ncbi:cytochrome P450 [Xylariales sp. PMI_506]|nr:cytochrome P450 [Xylariales sp. PMI_506]